jgi:chromosome segregation ATPase
VDTDDNAAESELKKLRSEAQALRRRLRDAESAQAEAEKAKLPELERLGLERDQYRQRVEALEASIKSERITRMALEISGALGAIEPGAVAKLVELATVEWDEDFRPTNVESLVKDLRKAHPRLFQAAAGDGNGGARDQTSAPLNSLDRMARAFAKTERR